jgi:hypothetical protein
MHTRSCRSGKLNESTRAKPRGGYLCGKVRISIYARHASFPNHARQPKHPSAVKCDTCAQKSKSAWCAMAGSGEGRGGEIQQCERGCRRATSRSRHLHVCAPLQSPAAAEVDDRGRRSKERRGGCEAVMRGCRGMAILLYTSRGPQ